jgi:aspartate carbamoyltransferase regulatory subunit
MSPSKTETKYKNRKLRYTFPSEHDEFSDNSITFKSQNSIPNNTDDYFECYNEKCTIITKNAEGTKKKVVIKKYTKIPPEPHP